MEGPSLYLAAEQLKPLVGQRILEVGGNTKIGKERLADQKVKNIFSWAKQLIFQFEGFALRVHFLLYGSFEAIIDGKSVTGDYVRTYNPRLVLRFANGQIKMFACSLRYIESPDAKIDYDFTADIMYKQWNKKSALKKISNFPKEQIADVLMDQDIFGGVGNIIKNEVLFITKVDPESLVENLSQKKLIEIVDETRKFSLNFYKWRKVFQLKKHLQVYRKSVCPVCGGKITRRKTGKRQRLSFYCPVDQSSS